MTATARYCVIVAREPVYSGNSWKRARSVFESLDAADLLIDGFHVASRVAGVRVRIPLKKIA